METFFLEKEIEIITSKSIVVDVFGAFCLNSPTGSIHLSRRKSQALITILASTSSQSETRTRLCGLLWSSNNEQTARVSLRQELTHLRKKTVVQNSPLIGTDKFTIWINREDVVLGSEVILRELNQNRIPNQLLTNDFLQGKFLSHLEDIDDELNIWVAVERNAFERSCTVELHRLIMTSENSKVREQASIAMIGLDPTDELAVRALIEIANSHENYAKAKKVFSDYCKRLREDHNMQPAQSVVEILNSPNSGFLPPSKDSTIIKVRVPARPLILAHQVERAVTTTGVSQPIEAIRAGLIGSLARFRDWAVREADLQHGNESLLENQGNRCFDLLFNAREAVDGSFLTITLRDRVHQEILWSDSIPIYFDDAIATHRATTRKIAAALNLEISARRLKMTLNQPESDLNQYDRWLRGQQLLLNWDANDEAKAESIFRSILAKWPSHAPAMSSLVEILNTRHHIFPGVMPDQKRIIEALELAHKAARISPQDSRIHLSLAWCYLMSRQYEQARYSFDLALQINDHDPLTLISAAMGYCFAGDKKLADKIATDALQVSAGGEPIHWAYHSCIRFFCGDLDAALDAASRASDSAHFMGGIRVAIAGAKQDRDLGIKYASLFQNKILENWFSSKNPSKKNIRNWLVASFPISLEADRDKLEQGLDSAGFV